MGASATQRKVSLVSQEGDAYEVEIEVCKMSELVKTMIPDGACGLRGLSGCLPACPACLPA